MEAVLSPRGQITIPVSLRRMLGLRGGERVAIDRLGDGIVIRNAVRTNADVFKDFQKDMKGAAEDAGWTCEQDVIDYCKQVRRKMWNERYAHNA